MRRRLSAIGAVMALTAALMAASATSVGAAVIDVTTTADVVNGGDGVTSLREAIIADPALLKKVEAVVHPLVAQDRGAFLYHMEREGQALVLCDIPLLFEGGGEAHMDKVVVVTAPPEVQRARVLERPGMTEEAFQAILAKQVPDAVKREKADYIVDTSKGMDHARARVAEIIAEVTRHA